MYKTRKALSRFNEMSPECTKKFKKFGSNFLRALLSLVELKCTASSEHSCAVTEDERSEVDDWWNDEAVVDM